MAVVAAVLVNAVPVLGANQIASFVLGADDITHGVADAPQLGGMIQVQRAGFYHSPSSNFVLVSRPGRQPTGGPA